MGQAAKFMPHEYDAHNNLVYKPTPLDEVWLDAEGCEQSKIDL